jgi:hypothetical protein
MGVYEGADFVGLALTLEKAMQIAEEDHAESLTWKKIATNAWQAEKALDFYEIQCLEPTE